MPKKAQNFKRGKTDTIHTIQFQGKFIHNQIEERKGIK